MPRLQRRVPRNILILILEKVGKHLRGERGGGRKGVEKTEMEQGAARRKGKRACSSSLGHLPWLQLSCVTGLSAEFHQEVGCIQGLCHDLSVELSPQAHVY